MKLAQLEKFLGLTNSKDIVSLLIDKSDDEIALVYDLFQSNQVLTDLQLITLVQKYFECGKNKNILFLISNEDFVKYRNSEEQIRLIDRLVELNFCENTFGLFYNKYILLYRTCEEQILLIDKYKELGQDNYVYGLIINYCMLKYRTCEEQISLIDKYMDLGKDDVYILQLICNNIILGNRTYQEQIQLIDMYVKSGNNKDIAELILRICAHDSFSYLEFVIDNYNKLNDDPMFLNIVLNMCGTENEKIMLILKYVKWGRDKGIAKLILEGNYTVEQRLYLIDKYIESGRSESFLKIIPFFPFVSYTSVLKNIDKYFEENKNIERNVIDLINELGSLREFIGILREQDIEAINRDTKINTYSNKSLK